MVVIGVICLVIFLSKYSEQSQYDNRLKITNEIITMDCLRLSKYSETDNGRDSREPFARSVYYLDDCDVKYGWLKIDINKCEKYFTIDTTAPLLKIIKNRNCQVDYFPTDYKNGIMTLPSNWFYTDPKTGEKYIDPNNVEFNIDRVNTFIIDENWIANTSKFYDIYYPEIKIHRENYSYGK